VEWPTEYQQHPNNNVGKLGESVKIAGLGKLKLREAPQGLAEKEASHEAEIRLQVEA
jgi:hypothetical protein